MTAPIIVLAVGVALTVLACFLLAVAYKLYKPASNVFTPAELRALERDPLVLKCAAWHHEQWAKGEAEWNTMERWQAHADRADQLRDMARKLPEVKGDRA